jgi:hypothetical protein
MIPIDSYALPAAQVLTVNRSNESIDSSRLCEALGVTVFMRIGAKVLKKRLPPGFGVSTVRDAGTRGVDLSPALLADQPRTDSHLAILP